MHPQVQHPRFWHPELPLDERLALIRGEKGDHTIPALTTSLSNLAQGRHALELQKFRWNYPPVAG